MFLQLEFIFSWILQSETDQVNPHWSWPHATESDPHNDTLSFHNLLIWPLSVETTSEAQRAVICIIIWESFFISINRRSVSRPQPRTDNTVDQRDIVAAAHDAAKINVSQRANVTLARSRGVLGARCVERKQPPPQDAPAAHIFKPKPLFLFPSEHPKPYSCLVSKSFDDSECPRSPKSAYDSFIICHQRVKGQIQTIIKVRLLISLSTQEFYTVCLSYCTLFSFKRLHRCNSFWHSRCH